MLAALARARDLAEADPRFRPYVLPLSDAQWLALVALSLLPGSGRGNSALFLFGGGSGGAGFGGLAAFFANFQKWLKQLGCWITCTFGCSDACGCKCPPPKEPDDDDDAGAVDMGPSAAETGAENPESKVPGCTKWLFDKCAPEGCPGSAGWYGAWKILQNNGCEYGDSPGAICYDEYGNGWSSPGLPQPSMCSCSVGCYKNGVKVKPKGK